MRKKVVITVLVVMSICFTVGLRLIFTAPDRGLSMSGSIVRSHGGSMDTNQLLVVLEGAITSYHIGGFIISLISGLGLILSGYVLYKKHTE